MATPLLKTKLYVPPVRADLVLRPHLVQRLEEGIRSGRRLTLLSAPAGFGKTTLLSEWVHGSILAENGREVAWLSLDHADNDLAQFWAYVIAALQTIRPDLGRAAEAMLQSASQPSTEALVASLVNEMAQEDQMVLVLDDYHVLTDPQVNEAMTFMLAHMPPSLHLIVAGRMDPPWPLARLRSSGAIVELRAGDLRFTLQEATLFLNDVMRLQVSAEDVAALDARTEGWIAGLQMAALSMQGRNDVASFVAAFSGSHRFVLDYLVEEVLERQTGDCHGFLLRTSILERMTASLCDAVTERQDGRAMLEHLERANLFVLPLDEQRHWYRYHPLFADLLRGRLEQSAPDQIAALHRRAGEWYQRNGLIVEAVSHAVAAGDAEQVARIAAQDAIAMLDHGRLPTLVRQLEALSGETSQARLWFSIARAWVLSYTGQFDDVEPRLQDVERVLRESPDVDGAAVQRIMGHMATIRAYVECLRGHAVRAGELADRALAQLAQDDVLVRAIALRVSALASQLGRDLETAASAYARSVEIARRADQSHVAVTVLADLAYVQILLGQLHRAAATCQEAILLAEEHMRRSGEELPAAGYVYLRLSNVAREWNELEAAERHARKAVELCRRWGMQESVTDSYITLALALQALGEEQGALEAIRQARQSASLISSWYAGVIERHEAYIRMCQEDLAWIARWLDSVQFFSQDRSEPGSAGWGVVQIALRWLVAQGHIDQASSLLDASLPVLEARAATGSIIEALVMRATILDARGEIDRALAALGRALALAEPEGYVRTFVETGAPLRRLLLKASARGLAPAYVARLLDALADRTTDRAPASVPPSPSSMVEPLSEREFEVLRLLRTDLTTREMAEELVVSVNTVRTHVRHVYGKLGVHDRSDAVQRAEELGLL